MGKLVEETGRSLEDWVSLVATSGLLGNPTDRSACRRWLVEQQGLTAERAKTLVAYAQLAVGLSERLKAEEPPTDLTHDEIAALEAFERAHFEFVREHFEEAERQFRSIIDTYSDVSEVVARARAYLKEARSRLSQIESGPKNPYEVLGVTARSTPQEITAAFRRLAQMYHPDKVESLAPEYREISKQKMLEINVAYDSLMRRR